MIDLKPGQIVNIRNRLWRIDSIYQNQLKATSQDSYSNIEKTFYIPFESITNAETEMPDLTKVGDLAKLELYITAHKLSQIHGSSPLMSLQRSSIIPINYQLVPVIMALNEPRVRLMIADDVGLGKTIEAGLILNELISRHTAKKILVICPANLREQWQEALRFQFKLDFRIISSLHKRELEKELPIGISPWDFFDKLITSVDYVKSKATRNNVLNYDWDLVLIDEAHLCARPHINAQKQSTMLRWEFLQRISAKAKHLLLLTATPHNGYTDSYASLIDTLDVGAINPGNNLLIDRDVAGNHICQRTRTDVIDWLKAENSEYNPFPEQDKKEIAIDNLSRNESLVYQALMAYGQNILKMVKFSTERDYLVRFTLLHFLKRFLSSPHSIRMSLKNRIAKLDTGDGDQEIKNAEAQATIVESDNIESFDSDEAGKRLERSSFAEEVIQFEIDTLKKILEKAKKITLRQDSKYQRLIKEVLPDLFQHSPKIIIFTRYKDTLDYLHENLEKSFSDCKVLNIYGQLKSEARKQVFAEFEQAEENAILIATDCISEGINLQYLCSQIIHYELPWNPNRMEQRNGRVDRFGQPEDIVHIRTFMVKNTLDELILKSIVEKADRMKRDYGFSPPFFSDETQVLDLLYNAGLTPRTRKLASDRDQLSIFDSIAEQEAKLKQEEQKQEDQKQEEILRQKMDQIKSDSFYGHTDISLPDIEKKIRQTASTIGSEAEISKFIISGLNLFNCKIQQTNDKLFEIIISDHRLLIPGMDNKIKKATFDKTYAANHPDVELIDISHPLITRLINLIKRQALINEEFNGRIAFKGSSLIPKTSVIIKALVRYVVETSPSSIIEEIITVALEPYSRKQIEKDQIKDFEKAPPESCNRMDQEVQEDINMAFSSNEWEEYLKAGIEEKRQELILERENLIKRLKTESEVPSWLQGITKVTYTRYDILTVTVGYPV